MQGLKEKVVQKISGVLHPARSTAAGGGGGEAHSERASALKEEHDSLQKSCLPSFGLPLVHGTHSDAADHGNVAKPSLHPMMPLPPDHHLKEGHDAFLLEDMPVEQTDTSAINSENEKANEEAEPGHFSVSNMTASAFHGNAVPAFNSDGVDLLSEKSYFITPDLFEFLQLCLPHTLREHTWILIYSTRKHGTSLRTLINRTKDREGPCLLIAGDMQGAVFGGMLESPLKATDKKKYLGTNQTFVFTTVHGVPTLFKATGANRYYYLCMLDSLAFGGGEHFALSLDEDLLHGTSGPCETFGNECLANAQEFELRHVELWGFSHDWSHHH